MNRNVIAFLLIASFALPLWAQTDANRIYLSQKKGIVQKWNVAAQKWEDIPEKGTIAPGLCVKTEQNSEAIIAIGKKGVITVAENSNIIIAAADFSDKGIKSVRVQNYKGKVWAAVEKLPDAGSEFKIETPNALAGVRGTVFMVNFVPEGNSTKVACLQGEVSVQSSLGAGYVILKDNTSTIVIANKAPIPPEVLEEKEKQEWQEWKESIPFSQMGIVGGIADVNAILSEEGSRLVREMGIAKKSTPKVLEDLKNIENAILLFYADTKAVPLQLKHLLEDPQNLPGWKGPYIGVGTTFKDPYDHRYLYHIKTLPGGKKYIELVCSGLIGAAGDEYGKETKHIFMDKLDAMLQERTGTP